MLFTVLKIKNYFGDIACQSQRQQQVPYGRLKLKTVKIDYFLKNISSFTFFEIKTSNFLEMFLDI